jgi:hypothetical protein
MLYYLRVLIVIIGYCNPQKDAEKLGRMEIMKNRWEQITKPPSWKYVSIFWGVAT